MALTAGLGDNMVLAGGQKVNTPFNNNVAPPGGHDHPMAFDGSLGDNPLRATQACLVDPRVAPTATISPDEIFCWLSQILTKHDNKVDASTLTTSIQLTIATFVEKALDSLLSPLHSKIESLNTHLESFKDNTATLTLTLHTEL